MVEGAFKPSRIVGGIWLVVAACNTSLSLIGPHAGADTLNILGTNLCGLCIALSLSSATQRIMRDQSRVAWPVLLGLVIIGGGTVWGVDGALQFWAGQQWSIVLPTASTFIQIRYNLVYFTLIFALQTAALALLNSNQALASRERQLSEARYAEQQAKLAALKLQLNPHFLFNTLNALSALVGDAQTREAQEVIKRLSIFLRSSLSSDLGEYTTLECELEMVQAYLEIEGIRFAERLCVSFECSPDLAEALVPALILQPLVENAMKYAVAPSIEKVTIEIHARRENSKLVLVVVDNHSAESQGVVSRGGGIGHRNIAARLEVLFGAQGYLKTSATKRGFAATVIMPLQFVNEANI